MELPAGGFIRHTPQAGRCRHLRVRGRCSSSGVDLAISAAASRPGVKNPGIASAPALNRQTLPTGARQGSNEQGAVQHPQSQRSRRWTVLQKLHIRLHTCIAVGQLKLDRIPSCQPLTRYGYRWHSNFAGGHIACLRRYRAGAIFRVLRCRRMASLLALLAAGRLG